MRARHRLCGLAIGAAVMLGCGSYQAPAMTAAKATIAASHDMIEGLCSIGFERAVDDVDYHKALEQCDVLKLSYEAAVSAVEAWEKASEAQTCTEPVSTSSVPPATAPKK